jgi:hypothetical protein
MEWLIHGCGQSRLNKQPSEFFPRRFLVDLAGESRFTKQLSVFVNLASITDDPDALIIKGPNTAAYGQQGEHHEFGSSCTVGIKGVI